MEKYISPLCNLENVEATDVILSSIQDQGEGTMGKISGQKGSWANDFSSLV